MNRKKKLLPFLLTLTLIFASCLINIYAHGETDPAAQDSVPQTSSEPSPAATSAPETVSSSKAVNTPAPSSKPHLSSSKASSYKASSKTKKYVKKVSVRQSSSAVSSAVSSASSDEVSQQEPSSVSLPSVGSMPEDDFTSSLAGNTAANSRTSWIGIISWACIILGVLVIVVVLLSNRRPPRGPGRKRYHRPKRRKKHLLNDKYYRHIDRY